MAILIELMTYGCKLMGHQEAIDSDSTKLGNYAIFVDD